VYKKFSVPAFIILAFFSASVCFGQTEKASIPAPYEKDEFPGWMQDLRRGEIILIGSFPLNMFLSYEFYDIFRYFSNNLESSYRPWPFRTYDAVPYNSAENIGIIVSAVSLSLVIAAADYLIGKLIENRNKPQDNDEKKPKNN